MRKVFVVSFVLLLGIQFFRPEKNASIQPQESDIFLQHPAPSHVERALRRSCYDCHSNSTTYPWYAEVQPAAWYLANHVREGKAHVNFSEFARYSRKRTNNKIEQCINALEDKSMPLTSYTLIHRGAQLSADERKSMIAWFETLQDEN